jgi:hypothetical protein
VKKLTLTTTLVLGFLIGSSAGIRVWEDSTHKKPSLLVFERQIIISTDFERRLLFSFGGPQLLFRIDQHTKIGPAYFPTLWWDYKKGEFDTKLGIGLLIDHRRTVIGLQTFRVGTVWKGAFGLGYRF